VRSLAKLIFRILHKVIAITAIARLTVTAAIFSVLTAQTVGQLIALTASHNLICKLTVIALALITAIFSQFLTTATVLATALRLFALSYTRLA
jgi:hypothetical protein